MNNDGSFTCSCNTGWTGDGTSCQDVDECGNQGTNNCDTNAECTNNDGSYTCQCKAGYQGDGTNGNCANINECTTNQHGCHTNAFCTDSPGSFTCTCNQGLKGKNY